MSSILISTNEDDGDEDTIGKENGDDNNIMTAWSSLGQWKWSLKRVVDK